MTHIPRDPKEITQDWLRSLFGDPAVRLERTEPLGGGYMSQLLRARLATPGRSVPARLLIKLATDDPQRREIALSFDSYRKEVRFYRHLRQHCNVRAPKCYASEIAPDGSRMLLVLEDMAAWQAVPQIESADKPRTMLAMRTLAALHAPMWNTNGHGLPLFEDAVAASARGLPETAAAALSRTGATLPPGVRELLFAYAAEPTRLMPSFLDMPQTLTHGDFRSSNLFFRGGDRAAVIDWGDYAFGPAAWDLAVFLTSSLSAENRRAWEQDAIRLYVACLKEAGVSYSFADCRDDYRLMMLPCSYLPAMAALGKDDANISLSRELFQRLAGAVEENLAQLQRRIKRQTAGGAALKPAPIQPAPPRCRPSKCKGP